MTKTMQKILAKANQSVEFKVEGARERELALKLLAMGELRLVRFDNGRAVYALSN